METFSVLLAICAGNSPVNGEFPAQRPVTRSFDVFFDLHLNKWLSEQSGGWWFEAPPCPLWRHCNEQPRPIFLCFVSGEWSHGNVLMPGNIIVLDHVQSNKKLPLYCIQHHRNWGRTSIEFVIIKDTTNLWSACCEYFREVRHIVTALHCMNHLIGFFAPVEKEGLNYFHFQYKCYILYSWGTDDS